VLIVAVANITDEEREKKEEAKVKKAFWNGKVAAK